MGIPSIAAALRGARVLATDWSPEALRFTTLNARRNGVRVETALCSWSEPDALVSRAPWHLVLASDVLYERRNVEGLLELLPRLVEGGEVLIADPGRPPAAAFLEGARREWCVRSFPDRPSPRVSIHHLRRRAEPGPGA